MDLFIYTGNTTEGMETSQKSNSWHANLSLLSANLECVS